MTTKKKTKKNPNARTFHTVPVRVDAAEYAALKALARTYTDGNVSTWVRQRLGFDKQFQDAKGKP